MNPARPGPKPGPVTEPVAPDCPVAGQRAAGDRASYAIHCGVLNVRGRRPRPGMTRRGDRTRTCNARLWRPLLYQLNYTPMTGVVPQRKTARSLMRGGRLERLSSLLAPPSTRVVEPFVLAIDQE